MNVRGEVGMSIAVDKGVPEPRVAVVVVVVVVVVVDDIVVGGCGDDDKGA
jgi:hypothetical protein